MKYVLIAVIITIIIVGIPALTINFVENVSKPTKENTVTIKTIQPIYSLDSLNKEYPDVFDSFILIDEDSCEYLVIGRNTYRMMSHRGNCKHCKNN